MVSLKHLDLNKTGKQVHCIFYVQSKIWKALEYVGGNKRITFFILSN